MAFILTLLSRATEAAPQLPLNRPFGANTAAVERLLIDGADGKFQDHSLIEAALTACGVDDRQTRTQDLSLFDEWVRELRPAMNGTARPEQQIARVLEFMHQRVFVSGYEASAYDVHETLAKGRFNCLSAVILLAAFAERFALDVTGIESPGHVVACLTLDEKCLAVEATEQGGHCWQVASTGNRPMQLRSVSRVGLVAMLFYNRGIELLEQGEYSAATQLLSHCVRLDPENRRARENLLATFNHWALHLVNSGDHAGACDLLTLAQELAPGHPSYQQNLRTIRQLWGAGLNQRGDFAGALQVVAPVK